MTMRLTTSCPGYTPCISRREKLRRQRPRGARMSKRVGDLKVGESFGGLVVLARDDERREAWVRLLGHGCTVQLLSYDEIILVK